MKKKTSNVTGESENCNGIATVMNGDIAEG